MSESLGWEWFVKKVQQKSGIDLTAYKRPQMERRINSFIRSVGANDYESFVKLINDNNDMYRRFIEHLTINVSEFFRNNNNWNVLREKIIGGLLQDRPKLKIWSAGCSTGEEPYSLAIMMNNWYPGKCEKILATDIDADALIKAREGIFSAKSVQLAAPELVKRNFEINGDKVKIKDEIKSLVTFQRHDLLKDSFPGDMDLILCRNVVIYFTEETKEKLYRRFVGALRQNGVLFIGSTEQIFQVKELGLETLATFFYRKV
ncbi:MAG: CheR family methyltransferase [Chitinophagales bacterium]